MREVREYRVFVEGGMEVVVQAVACRVGPSGDLHLLIRDDAPGAGTESTAIHTAFAHGHWRVCTTQPKE